MARVTRPTCWPTDSEQASDRGGLPNVLREPATAMCPRRDSCRGSRRAPVAAPGESYTSAAAERSGKSVLSCDNAGLPGAPWRPSCRPAGAHLTSGPGRRRPLWPAGALAAVAAPPASAASTCTVAYSVVNNWPGGFQVGITVTNNGAPITSWTLAFTFPNAQQISGGWSGTYTQSGQYVTVASMSYNGALGTGGSVSLGFTGTVGSVNAVPSYFTVNGYACNGAPQVPSVNITSPASGSGLTPGSNASITANASEPTASISKVEFFEASTLPGTSHTPVLIGTATASPYAVTWPSVPAGYYSLTAEAFDSAGVTGTSAPVAVAAVPATSTAPQLHVSGNQLVNASGTPVVLHGVNRSGGEFACVQGTGLWNGPMDQASITAMKSWGITAVRVPLNEACWNAESYVNSAYAGANYISAIKSYVSLLNSNGIVAILDLHWTDGT